MKRLVLALFALALALYLRNVVIGILQPTADVLHGLVR